LIFVCTGSRNYQFNRLIKEIDCLVKEEKIKERVFAQIGETDYIPQFFEYRKYIDADEYEVYQNYCDILITHGGTGSIVKALKKGKNVIAVPRLKKYGEHIDDHQLQIVQEYVDRKQIRGVWEIKDLWKEIVFFQEGNQLNSYHSEHKLIKIVDRYIQDNFGGMKCR